MDPQRQHWKDAPAANLIAGRNPVIEAIKSGRESNLAGAESSVVKIKLWLRMLA